MQEIQHKGKKYKGKNNINELTIADVKYLASEPDDVELFAKWFGLSTKQVKQMYMWQVRDTSELIKMLVLQSADLIAEAQENLMPIESINGYKIPDNLDNDITFGQWIDLEDSMPSDGGVDLIDFLPIMCAVLVAKGKTPQQTIELIEEFKEVNFIEATKVFSFFLQSSNEFRLFTSQHLIQEKAEREQH